MSSIQGQEPGAGTRGRNQGQELGAGGGVEREATDNYSIDVASAI